MKTAIITDSNSEVSEQEAESRGIYVVPMPVIINNTICLRTRTFLRSSFLIR